MSGVTISRSVDTGGNSQKVAMTTISAQSTAIGTFGPNQTRGDQSGLPLNLLITVDATCAMRQGINPTTVIDGTDQILLAGVHRIVGFVPGNKLAFATLTGTGNAYITPEV